MKKLILLVEDNLAICRNLEIFLNTPELPEVNLIYFQRGSDAIDYINNNGKYDLLICDLSLGDMGGDEVIAKSREVKPYVPIFVFTSFNEISEYRRLSPFFSSLNYIRKPFELDDLLKRIKEKIY